MGHDLNRDMHVSPRKHSTTPEVSRKGREVHTQSQFSNKAIVSHRK